MAPVPLGCRQPGEKGPAQRPWVTHRDLLPRAAEVPSAGQPLGAGWCPQRDRHRPQPLPSPLPPITGSFEISQNLTDPLPALGRTGITSRCLAGPSPPGLLVPTSSPRSGPSSEVLSIPGGLCLLPGAFRAAKACPRAPQAFLHANSCFPQYDQYQLIYIPVLQNLRTSACQHVLGRGDADRAIGTAWKKPSCHWGWGHGHAGGCTPASSH